MTTSLASNTVSPSLQNQQSQNWILLTITAPDQLDRLTALYRYVTVPGADLCREYPEVRVAADTQTEGVGTNPSDPDAMAWNVATSADAIEAYKAYKAAFPMGHHLEAANLREEQIRKEPDSTDAQLPPGRGLQDCAATRDLISAARCAFMMRRKGKGRSQCEGYGRTPGTGDFPMSARSPQRQRIAQGVGFDVFTGQ